MHPLGRGRTCFSNPPSLKLIPSVFEAHPPPVQEKKREDITATYTYCSTVRINGTRLRTTPFVWSHDLWAVRRKEARKKILHPFINIYHLLIYFLLKNNKYFKTDQLHVIASGSAAPIPAFVESSWRSRGAWCGTTFATPLRIVFNLAFE
jgi:hypothetical protein